MSECEFCHKKFSRGEIKTRKTYTFYDFGFKIYVHKQCYNHIKHLKQTSLKYLSFTQLMKSKYMGILEKLESKPRRQK